jgi:hypothetical protein
MRSPGFAAISGIPGRPRDFLVQCQAETLRCHRRTVSAEPCEDMAANRTSTTQSTTAGRHVGGASDGARCFWRALYHGGFRVHTTIIASGSRPSPPRQQWLNQTDLRITNLELGQSIGSAPSSQLKRRIEDHDPLREVFPAACCS